MCLFVAVYVYVSVRDCFFFVWLLSVYLIARLSIFVYVCCCVSVLHYVYVFAYACVRLCDCGLACFVCLGVRVSVYVSLSSFARSWIAVFVRVCLSVCCWVLVMRVR